MEKILRPLCDTPHQAYMSDIVQVADLLDWILSQVGRAEVRLSSFSVSEEFLRRIFFIKRRHDTSSFSLVLDHKATQKTLRLWTFISRVADKVYLADNHSKVILVRAASGHTVSVVTSQNLTRGNRMESAFISTSAELFASLLLQFENLSTYHSVPLHDIIRQRIGTD